jgi:hypothetical protein
MIEEAAAEDPRSLQKQIGPSGLGGDCIHCLACAIFQIPKREDPRDIWNQTVGHACHHWMEQQLLAKNAAAGRTLFHPERKVYVGDIGPMKIHGSADCYDVEEQVVVDWKFPGDNTMSKVRQGYISESYRRQPHLYGLGYGNEGFEVRGVMVLFIPRNDRTVRNAYAHKVNYDRTLAEDTMDRANRLYDLVIRDGGPAAVIPRLRRDEHCWDCPRYAL